MMHACHESFGYAGGVFLRLVHKHTIGHGRPAAAVLRVFISKLVPVQILY